ncbi:hypothetical protein FYZ48_10915 [Gimesia chilikensis]|uniref:hypothetical protein n=1 Tax=Gimesia chilikensis TaxID=2605989 RepID=UPI0011EE98B5|nr:hypothetical protein [Gimesia chilikensis]KAA0139147.1 hypothetical protein FYZ48_10915 [Gimesia chilikensis]
MAFLGGLEILIAKPLLGLLAKVGISGKVATALSAGAAVGISALAIKKGIEWANRTYGVQLKEEWILIGKSAINIALSSRSCIEALQLIDDEATIQTASSILAHYGSEAFGSKIDPWCGEATIAAIMHAIGDEEKLGLAT